MDQKAYLAVVGMLNSFPQANSNPDLTMGTYEQVLQGLSPQAVTEAAQRFTMGDVAGQSKTFAPSIAEFVAEARSRQEYIDLKAKPRLPAPRYFPGPLAPFQIRQQKRLSQYANHPILFENVSYDQFRKMSAMKEIPVGAFWTSMGIVYGPAPKHQIEGERNVG
jgi:hypothetical protein